MTDPARSGTHPAPSILLDTDPGGDDAVALMWLASLVLQQRAELVCVTTVDGNVEPERTYANASGLLRAAGLTGVPVGRGAPCARARRRAARVHGADGLGGQSARLPAAAPPFREAPASVELIVDQLASRPGQITLLAVGPLTNLAAAERRRPGILRLARDIIVMGGGFTAANVTPVAEFNIHFDPESAAASIGSRPDLALIPLDLTLQLLLTRDRVEGVVEGRRDTPLAALVKGLCDFMIRAAIERGASGGVGGFPVHDAATVAAVFYPETLAWREGRLAVDSSHGPDSGRTTFQPEHDDSRLARVAFSGDPDRLLDALCNDLAWLIATVGQSE